jgi:TetR/AcrR family transcriptional repressor of bet genes
MPKLGMEPIRRAELIDAAIAEIGEAGSLDITVSQIARRAGVSSGLAHHYFGNKDKLLLAAMRHVMSDYSDEVRKGLKAANTPIERLNAIVHGGFAPSNFRANTVSAWLNFYVLALSSREARRLHRIYAHRLRSNLTHTLRPLAAARAPQSADRAAALIDGLYLNYGLDAELPDGNVATEIVMATIIRDIADS